MAPSRSALLLVPALLLASCRHSPDLTSAASARLVKGTLTVGGHERTFLYLEPRSRAGVLPLVVSLHGRLGTGQGQDRLTGFAALAEAEGFLLVLPDGVDRSWHDAREQGPAAEQGIDDTEFLTTLVELFVREHGADPARIYVAGMSNGAEMAQALVCRQSVRVAAVVAVTGNLPEALVGDCVVERPVSVALILGTDDPLMPYEGGEVAGHRGRILSAQASARFWAMADGCTQGPVTDVLPDRDPADGTRVERSRWSGCREGVEVVLYKVEGGGHTWPGGWAYLGERVIGRVSRDLDATVAAWELFRAHARP